VGQDKMIRFWDVMKGMETKKIGPTPDDLYGVQWSKEANALATIGYAGNISLWELDKAMPVFTTRIAKNPGHCITFTRDGKAVVTGHDNGSFFFTPIKKGK
jgi:WD40 repeat protein